MKKLKAVIKSKEKFRNFYIAKTNVKENFVEYRLFLMG